MPDIDEQLGQRNPESFGDHFQIQNRDITFAALDGTNERPMQIALFAKFVLRQAPGDASFANAITDPTEKSLLDEIHA